ncbi:MAG: inositol monophosphatase [Balneolaceae bacterium]|nr:inositol monophosphatase [Balneolaceae bacterium]
MSDYSNELLIAKKAANQAAEIIRNFSRKSNFQINYKGRNDLVTDADIAAEEKIIGVIKNHFPDDQILAEESSEEHVLPVERTWLIDPIDGTTNFAHGFPVFCVSIGLWKQQKPKMGLVLEVNSGECFYATAGEGAFLNETPIQVSAISESNHAMIGTGFPYNDMSLSTNYIRFFKWLLQRTQAVRRPGAASYDLCCVAAGRFDGFYEYSLNPWDVGAAGLIVKEAGGMITDWEGGDNWLFGERVVAGNADIHAFLLRAINEHFSAEELRL